MEAYIRNNNNNKKTNLLSPVMVQPSSVTLSLNTIVRVHKGELIKDIP